MQVWIVAFEIEPSCIFRKPVDKHCELGDIQRNEVFMMKIVSDLTNNLSNPKPPIIPAFNESHSCLLTRVVQLHPVLFTEIPDPAKTTSVFLR